MVSKDQRLGQPLYGSKVASSSLINNIVKLTFDNLLQDVTYYYGLEIDGVLQDDGRGKFRTYPKKPLSFTFSFGNSLKNDFGRPSISGMVASLVNNPLFFLCTGDLFYEDIATNDFSRFRSAYEKALRRPTDLQMGREVPFVYMWDDHDYGPNNSDRTAPGRTASIRVYRETIPHYPTANPSESSPIYQAFSVGSARFILTDLRSERTPNHTTDNSSKTMMGTVQREWFFSELAASSKANDVVFWVSTVPYTAPKRSGSDDWGGFSTERTMIADFIKKNSIKNLMIISGDAHCLAAGNGKDSDYATGGGAPLPEILAAPLDSDDTSVKGGPWSQGTFRVSAGTCAFGLVTVTFGDQKTTVTFSGRDNKQKERISLVKEFSKVPTSNLHSSKQLIYEKR